MDDEIDSIIGPLEPMGTKRTTKWIPNYLYNLLIDNYYTRLVYPALYLHCKPNPVVKSTSDKDKTG